MNVEVHVTTSQHSEESMAATGRHVVQLVFQYRGHQRSVRISHSAKAPSKADWTRIACKAWEGVLGDSFELHVDGVPSFPLKHEDDCAKVWEMAGVSRADVW